MEWQPIETAPRDGTAILIHSSMADKNGCRIVRWAQGGGGETDVPRQPHWQIIINDGEYCYVSSEEASHWMPLPERPPQSERTGE